MPEEPDYSHIIKKHNKKRERVTIIGYTLALCGVALGAIQRSVDINYSKSLARHSEVGEYIDAQNQLAELKTPIRKTESALESLEGVSSGIIDSINMRNGVLQPLYNERNRLITNIEEMERIPIVEEYIRANSLSFFDIFSVVGAIGLVAVGLKGQDIANGIISSSEDREIANYYRKLN